MGCFAKIGLVKLVLLKCLLDETNLMVNYCLMMTMSVGCVFRSDDVHGDLEQEDGWNHTVESTSGIFRKDFHNMDFLDNSDVMILAVAERRLILM